MDKLIPINPYTLEKQYEFPLLSFATLESKVALARQAFETWRRTDVNRRVTVLHEALQYFETNRDAVASSITWHMGKPLTQAQNEVNGLLERARYMMSITEQTLAPEILPEKLGFHRRIEHSPLGVVLVIAPWNYPLLTAVNGIITALLAGNTVLLKHSSLTPGIGEHFAKAFGNLAGIEGVLQSIVASHSEMELVIEKADLNHVIFTGSVEAGQKVQRLLAARTVYPNRFLDCNLELGGKDGAYVAEDADVAKAAADLVDGVMYNAGQSCCGIERVYVHRRIYDEFIERCEQITKAYILGDPMLAQTGMGPLASAGAAHAMEQQVNAAIAQGAKLLVGGHRKQIERGTFFEPTLLLNVDHTMQVMREENFGPILPIMRVEGDKQGFRQVAESQYGLTSVIYTTDLERANRFAQSMDTGTVFMNRCDYLDPALPWTGVRDSGRGSTLSKYGFYALTRRKAIHFRLP